MYGTDIFAFVIFRRKQREGNSLCLGVSVKTQVFSIGVKISEAVVIWCFFSTI